MKLKTLLAGALSALAIAAQACWFTADNFNACYLAGVNNYVPHYAPAEAIGNAVYKNGQTVDLPITVWVKVSDRFADQAGETAGNKPVVKAVLQYKVLPDGAWVTVRTLQNLNWKMDFNRPIALFGKNNINPKGLAAGTAILIRVYFSDGTYETGNLSTDITSAIPDSCTQESGSSYQGGWTAPFVMKVVISGAKRPK